MSLLDKDELCGCYTTATGPSLAYGCTTHKLVLTSLFSGLFDFQKGQKKERLQQVEADFEAP